MNNKQPAPSGSAAIYNVKAVAQLTGLSPTTLRAWERRYGLPAPQRGAQGYRLYSDDDIRTLKWLTTQLDAGLSISRAVERLTDLRASGQDPLAAEPDPIAQAVASAGHVQPLTAGSLAPSVTVLDANGKPFVLADAWKHGPVLLAFLRHFGCIFCRELLGSFHQQQPAITAAGLKLTLIGLGDPDDARQVCGQLVPGALCLSNKTAEAYAAYGFNRGSLLQLAGPSVMSSAVRAARSGYFQGDTTGDLAMLGGLFIIDSLGFIRYAFYSRHAGDNPNLADVLAEVGQFPN